jgi:putative hemolysin
VISLLWTGLAKYMTEFDIRYYMGCGSIHSTDVSKAMEIYTYIKSKNSVSDIYVPPLQKCELPGYSTRNTIEINPSIIKSIPPLIKGYLRIGAKLSCEPALDKVFGTTDFFVLFDQKSITDRYLEKYF